jgi:hypothetical protein
VLLKRVPTKNIGSHHSARISALNAQGPVLPACVIGVHSHACASNDSSAYAAKESSWDVSASTTGSVCTLTSSAAVIVPIPSVYSLTTVKNPRNVIVSASTSHTPPDTSLFTAFCGLRVTSLVRMLLLRKKLRVKWVLLRAIRRVYHLLLWLNLAISRNVYTP